MGLGTWPLLGEECEEMVSTALASGYRMIDTSHKYANEDAVGRGIHRSAVPRDEIFVTSKFNKEDHSVDGVHRAYEESLKRLGLEYLDLFLCHWPVPWEDRYVDAWKGLVSLVEQGLVKAIGVSNFKPDHIDRIVAATGYVPDVNQIQLSVDLARAETRKYHSRHGILTESWSPLGRGAQLRELPQIVELAEKLKRSPAQILLRWHVQQGIVPIPRSSNADQMQQNIALFDFEIPETDLVQLEGLDRGEAAARDSNEPENGH
ncbi:aldo/keto reductase [Leucobacter sp. Z1108]|uniref:aldo/keto reductase n=1 Tax=Microbacteriaceae TaxID=85023 RepID=UPI003A9273FD